MLRSVSYETLNDMHSRLAPLLSMLSVGTGFCAFRFCRVFIFLRLLVGMSVYSFVALSSARYPSIS